MEKLWAPWRATYITKIVKEKRGCIFCRILKENKDGKNYIIARTPFSYAVLNIFPYNNGHTLILPKRHVNDLAKLTKIERDDLLNLLNEVKDLLNETLKPGGFNIGLNLGRAAGAGVPRHLHFHIVPRWKGDANFMPVIAKTKVISQSLKELHKMVTHAQKRRIRKVRI